MEASEGDTEQKERAPLVGILGAAALFTLLCLRYPLSGSLWLDESITKWATDGSFGEVAERILPFQGQSPFYFWIVHLTQSFTGFSEFTLRLPSIVFAFGAALLGHLAIRKLSTSAVASVAIMVLVASNAFAKVAVNARPYSLAFLFVLLSTWLLFQWLSSKKLGWLTAYGLAMLGVFYSHYLFGLVVFPHLLFLLVFRGGVSRREVAHFSVLAVVALLCALPGLGHLLEVAAKSDAYFFQDLPGGIDLAKGLFPPRLTFALLTALIATWCFIPFKLRKLNAQEKALLAVSVIWWVTLPLFYFGYSHIAGSSLFFERFFGWSVIPYSITWGVLIGAATVDRARVLALVIFAGLVVLIPRDWKLENWRETIESANKVIDQSPEMPVLLYTGLIEMEQVELLSNPDWEEYLKAPLASYPLKREPVLIPSSFRPDHGDAYYHSVIAPHLKDQSSFLLISPFLKQFSDRTGKGKLPAYYLDYFQEQGFQAKRINDKGLIATYHIKKIPSEEANPSAQIQAP